MNASSYDPKHVFYMNGLTVDDFNCVLECIELYISVIIYPDCKTNQDGKENSQRELNCCVILQYAVIHCTLESWLSSRTQVIQLYPVFFLHGQYFFQLFLTLLTSVHTRGKLFHCYPKGFGLLVFRTLYY